MQWMEDDYDESKVKRYKLKIALVIGAVVFLIVIVLLNRVQPYNKDFSTDNFYWGKYYDDETVKSLMSMNSKEYYNKMKGSKQLPDSVQCSKELIKSDNAQKVEGTSIYWLSETKINSESDISQYEKDGGKGVYAWPNGGNIISPVDITFTNNNQSSIVNGDYQITFELQNSNGTNMVVHNIKTWFCHIGKDNPTSHTLLIGENGDVSSIGSGYVIGEATADTYFNIYDSEGNEIKVEDYYFH